MMEVLQILVYLGWINMKSISSIKQCKQMVWDANLHNFSLCQLKDHHSLYECYVPMKYKRYYKKMAKQVSFGQTIAYIYKMSDLCGSIYWRFSSNLLHSPSIYHVTDLENGGTMLPCRQLLIRFSVFKYLFNRFCEMLSTDYYSYSFYSSFSN